MKITKLFKCLFGQHDWRRAESFPKIGMAYQRCRWCGRKRVVNMKEGKPKWLTTTKKKSATKR